MERRFTCTACGKCCYGWLPLTIADALANADRFPLAVMFSPVRQGAKSFERVSRLGTTIALKKKKQAALRVSPIAYLPSTFPCPALGPDGLCSIHDDKPLRCRAMPFSPYQDEADQAGFLVPRPGWECDTSDAAAVVYSDKGILDKTDFDAEEAELSAQAGRIKGYADWILQSAPDLMRSVHKMALKPTGGHVIANFSTVLPRLPKVNVYDFAAVQEPVLREYEEKTAGNPALADYHRRYRDSADEMAAIVRNKP